jgi:hypothetical protein
MNMIIYDLAMTNGYTFVGIVLIGSGLVSGLMTASLKIKNSAAIYAIALGVALLIFGAA